MFIFYVIEIKPKTIVFFFSSRKDKLSYYIYPHVSEANTMFLAWSIVFVFVLKNYDC